MNTLSTFPLILGTIKWRWTACHPRQQFHKLGGGKGPIQTWVNVKAKSWAIVTRPDASKRITSYELTFQGGVKEYL